MRNFLSVSAILTLFFLCNHANAQGSFGIGNEGGYFGGFGLGSVQQYTSPARYDSRIVPALVRAARIAEQRAGRHSTSRCWHFVKDALVDAGAVRSRPTSAYANQAGEELMRQHGFVRLRISDPYRAPIGSVIVYAGYGAGHVELRTAHGFASDYRSPYACRYRMIGVYAKFNS